MIQNKSDQRRVLLASLVGSVIEWYDYALYGTAAALVFAHLFFPNTDPAIGTIVAFGTFAVGFVARPIGGFVAGHFGDRIGRKTTLVMSLMTMGIATTLIGVLPTYQQVGFLAPVLLVLLRLLQGFAVGGEWGGAAIMAVENAPRGREGYFGAFPQTGVSAGLVLGTGAFAIISSLVPDQDFIAWGWRIPFLFSIVLMAVGLFVRFRIGESPAFEQARKHLRQEKRPLVEVVRRYPKNIMLGIGARFAEAGNYYIYTVFILAFVAQHTTVSKNVALVCIMIAATLNVLFIPMMGALSDRVGRRPVIITGAVFLAAMAYPFFLMVGSGSPILMGIALVLTLGLGHAAAYGPIAAYYCELFPVNVRFSGISICYQMVSILLGGFTPMVASMLTAWSGGEVWPVALLVGVTSLIAGLTLAISHETAPRIAGTDATARVAAQPATAN